MPQPTSVRTNQTEQSQTAGSTPQSPVEKFNDGPVRVSIWENQGTKGAFRTATIELRYRDSQQQWQTGKSYSASDLLHLEAAAREARSRIETWRQANARKPAPQH
jgi:hypothetical protein